MPDKEVLNWRDLKLQEWLVLGSQGKVMGAVSICVGSYGRWRDWNGGKAGSPGGYMVFPEDPPSPGRLSYPELLVQFSTEKGTSNSNSSC